MKYQKLYESLRDIGYTDEEAIAVIKRSYPTIAVDGLEEQNAELISVLKEVKMFLSGERKADEVKLYYKIDNIISTNNHEKTT